MWQIFWTQNIHYILEVFVGFLMITAGWIYLDGWLIQRYTRTLVRSVSFFLLTFWSLFHAVPNGVAGVNQIIDVVRFTNILGLLGFGGLLLSLITDPVPVKPGEKPIRFFSKLWEGMAGFTLFHGSIKELLPDIPTIPIPDMPSIRIDFGRLLAWISPILGMLAVTLATPEVWMLIMSGLITYLLWLHYNRGVQREWKYKYLGFLILTVALGLSSLASTWQDTTNVLFARLFSPFHAVWIMEHVAKFLGAIFLGAWAWGFIRFRIFPQILSSIIAVAFLIFMVTAVIYTGFLLQRTQASIISGLETNVKMLDFALTKVKESAVLAARITASNPNVQEALKQGNRDALHANLNALMFENGTDFMLAINTGGEVVMRAEDKERFGESIAEDPVVWRALDGKAIVTSYAEHGVHLPVVSIRAASPIVDTSQTGEPEIIGAIVTGFLVDTAFVDGIKKITNLEVTVFANEVSTATTFNMPDSGIRLLGTKETDERILDQVLKKGHAYTGAALVLNEPFLASYIPLKDIQNTTIGMLFTGKSQGSILSLISETIQLTFTVSIILMILSILPLWWLARFISHYQRV